MDVALEVTVVAVQRNDTRVNFNFVTADRGEIWCLGSLNSAIPSSLEVKVDDRLRMLGECVTDSSGSRVFFFARHIEHQA